MQVQKFNFKILLIIIVLICISGEISAQMLPGGNAAPVKPRNKPDGITGIMYAGVVAKSANSLDLWGFDVGAQFGGMISDHFGLGAGIYTLLSQNIRIKQNEKNFLRLSYGGIEPQFVFKFGNVALSTKVLLGLGFAGVSENVSIDLMNFTGEWIYVTEPSVGISYIFDDTFWLTVEGGWRATGKVGFIDRTPNDLNGPVVSLSFKTVIN